MQGEKKLVIHWTSLVMKNTKEFPLSDFVNRFLYVSFCLLNSDVVPRISSDIKIILQLCEKIKVGD